jgi:hypothetical protein
MIVRTMKQISHTGSEERINGHVTSHGHDQTNSGS